MAVVVYVGEKRKAHRALDPCVMYVKVEQVIYANSNGLRKDRDDIIYFSLLHGNKIIHQIDDRSAGSIDRLKVSIGNTYRAEIECADVDNYIVDYSSPVDTLIPYPENYARIYKSATHQQIVENGR